MVSSHTLVLLFTLFRKEGGSAEPGVFVSPYNIRFYKTPVTRDFRGLTGLFASSPRATLFAKEGFGEKFLR